MRFEIYKTAISTEPEGIDMEAMDLELLAWDWELDGLEWAETADTDES